MDKTCNRCGLCKPIGDFYRNPRSHGGYLNQCKACVIKRQVKKNAENKRADRERRWNMLTMEEEG